MAAQQPSGGSSKRSSTSAILSRTSGTGRHTEAKSRLLAVGAQAAPILTLAEFQIGWPTPTTYVFAPMLGHSRVQKVLVRTPAPESPQSTACRRTLSATARPDVTSGLPKRKWSGSLAAVVTPFLPGDLRPTAARPDRCRASRQTAGFPPTLRYPPPAVCIRKARAAGPDLSSLEGREPSLMILLSLFQPAALR